MSLPMPVKSLEILSSLKGKDLVCIDDLSHQQMLSLFDLAQKIKKAPHSYSNLLKNYLLASCFFEPSTRTKLSFEAAMKRLGGDVIGFSDSSNISTKKGESLSDTMRVIERYVDIATIRHPLEGSAQCAADVCKIPIINSGDGSNEHPTQTLLDLFTISECQGKLDNLNIALVGDLKNGRTVHSLSLASVHFGMRLFFISPQILEIPSSTCDQLKKRGVRYSFHRTIDEVIHKIDILYMTRIQRERFTFESDYEKVRNSYTLTTDQLIGAKENLKILHPLPRLNEIDRSIDDTPFAYYFQQSENGLYIRQALLLALMGKI